MVRNSDGTIDLNALDPAVSAAIFRGSQLAKDRRLPKKERRSAIREREKAAKRKERRVGYDMEPEVSAEIAAIAERNSTTASQVAQLALQMFLAAYKNGDVDLVNYRQLCAKNPRYDYVLVFKSNTPP
jgi:hypothetical protein